MIQVKGRFWKEIENAEEFEGYLSCTLKQIVKFLSGSGTLGRWSGSDAMPIDMWMTVSLKQIIWKALKNQRIK